MDFNKIIKECSKDIEIRNSKNRQYIFQNESEFINSVKNDMKNFNITSKNKIDTIIYNKNNADGVLSSAIVYNYLKENNQNNINLFRLGAGTSNLLNIKNQLYNKNIIILDLQYDDNTLNQLNTNRTIVIDDHNNFKLKGKDRFVGSGNHSCVAYTWNLFYPKRNMPRLVQYIDVGDSKKHAKHLPFSHLIGVFFSYRYSSSPYISSNKWNDGQIFENIWKLINEDNYQMWLFIGKYMQEIQENIKEQIARNAIIKTFIGKYKVAVLNYLDPVLTKSVMRQMITNFKNKGIHVDFAITYGFEFNKNLYKVQMIDDHVQTKINLGQIAKELGKTKYGGGGYMHVGNFYYPKDKNNDIWDLFS